MSLARFHALQSLISKALAESNFQKVEELVSEYLSLAEEHPTNWNFGNAIHTSHIALGKVAFLQNDVGAAKEHLLNAAATPGSPQLNSFGPNMALAKDLLVLGEKEVVLEYLKLCEKFWIKEFSQWYLDSWRKDIEEGIVPNFRGHLLYHFDPQPAG